MGFFPLAYAPGGPRQFREGQERGRGLEYRNCRVLIIQKMEGLNGSVVSLVVDKYPCCNGVLKKSQDPHSGKALWQRPVKPKMAGAGADRDMVG